MSALAKTELLQLLKKKAFEVVDATEFYNKNSVGLWLKKANINESTSKINIELSNSFGCFDKFPISDMLKKHGWKVKKEKTNTLILLPI